MRVGLGSAPTFAFFLFMSSYCCMRTWVNLPVSRYTNYTVYDSHYVVGDSAI